MEYLVLLGGGRAEERDESRRALRDIASVLEPYVPVISLWLDEHGGLWQKDIDSWQAVAISQGKLFKINQQEINIGGSSEGVSIQQIWPVVFGRSYDWSGLASLARVCGCRGIGTSGVLAVLLKDNQIARRILSEYQFSDGGVEIERKDWLQNYQDAVRKIKERVNFPVIISARGIRQKVTLVETIENFIWQIFEDQEELEKILIKEYKEEEKEIAVGFVGRKNWLPSKSVVFDGQQWQANEDSTENRLAQDWLMEFVAKYDVTDYGLIRLKKSGGNIIVDQIDIFPDLTRLGLYALLWQKSGLNYEELIKKIYIDSLN